MGQALGVPSNQAGSGQRPLIQPQQRTGYIRSGPTKGDQRTCFGFLCGSGIR